MIDDQVIDIVKDRLVSTYKPMVIYLFGSYAWGNPNEGSDLDILIIINSSKEKPHRRTIKGIRSLRGLKISKDILVYTKNEFDILSSDATAFCYKIKNEGIKLYEAV